jgi:hypothetical protein
MHFANIIVDAEKYNLIEFDPIERIPIDGLIQEWEISDMFERELLDNPSNLSTVINNRIWNGKIQVEEGTAANISRKKLLYNGKPGGTVFAKIVVHSDKDQIKLFNFGHNDVIAILNGVPIYKETNKWQCNRSI